MTEHVLDSTLRRDVALQQFATYLRREYLSFAEFNKEFPSLIANYDQLSRQDFNVLRKAISDAFGTYWDSNWTKIAAELQNMATDEALHVYNIYSDIDDKLKPVSKTLLTDIVRGSVMVLESGGIVTSGLWSELVTAAKIAHIKTIDSIIRAGYRDGLTAQEMTRRIIGKYNRKTKDYSGGAVNGVVKARATTLVRTGVAHYANRARDAFAEQNKNVIVKKIFFATLDHRTTDFCFAHHLDQYKLSDKKAPVLPHHFNERSLYVYATQRFDPLTMMRPAIGGKASGKEAFEARKNRSGGKVVKYRGRRDMDTFNVEQIKASVTADQWMRRQPRWFVEQALGKTKAKLFLDGGLKMDGMVDAQGKSLTLDELRQTSAGERAFMRAGL